MKKSKIVIIGLKGLPAYGGAAAVGENIVLSLQDKFDFTVLSLSTFTELKTGDYRGVHQVVFRSCFKRSAFNTAYYYFRSLLFVLFHHFDLIHIHHNSAGFLTILLRIKAPIVLTIHGLYKNDRDLQFSGFQNLLIRTSERVGLKSANVVVSVSEPDREYLIGKYHRDVLYIPNGVSANSSRPRSVFNDKGYILFAAGRITDVKGLHLLLEAAYSLKLDKHIVIVGDLDRIPEYKQRITEESESLNTSFLGLIKDKSQLRTVVDDSCLFIFPSLHEGMSMMLLEVVEQGIPTIASDIVANKAIFSEKEMLFFKSNDSSDLAEKLSYALDNYDDMKERSRNAYDLVQSKYTWDVIAKQYSDIYMKLISKS